MYSNPISFGAVGSHAAETCRVLVLTIQYLSCCNPIGFGAVVSRPVQYMHFSVVNNPSRSLLALLFATFPLGLEVLCWNPEWRSSFQHEQPELFYSPDSLPKLPVDVYTLPTSRYDDG